LEITFPVGEGTTVGILYTARELWSVALGGIVSLIFDGDVRSAS